MNQKSIHKKDTDILQQQNLKGLFYILIQPLFLTLQWSCLKMHFIKYTIL